MFLLINKPKGITSHGVVNALRKITGEKRIGHAGTLDPNATGLLILGIGRESTKKLDKFLKLDKEYLADIYLGEERDTDDVEGKTMEIPKQVHFSQKVKSLRDDNTGIKSLPVLSNSEIEDVLKTFIGKQLQTPPVYSAIKVKGKEAYKLARTGKDVELKPREITVYEVKLLKYDFPILTVKFKVSSGTYIRSLARDIGRKLSTGAYLSDLIRTKVGKYNLKKAVLLNELNPENWKSFTFDI